MDVKTACEILCINVGASDDELEKAFKKMAVKYHPDKNKGNEKYAEDNFKKMNTAYQFLKQNGTQVRNYGFYDQSNLNDIFADFFKNTNNYGNFGSTFRRVQQDIPIKGTIELSFEESIIGCQKQVIFNRKCICNICNGTGKGDAVHGICKKCNNKKTINVNGKDLPCTSCGGTGSLMVCSNCSGTGVFVENKELSINIPAGVEDGIKIKLAQEGDYINKRHLDAIFSISVLNDEELFREENDVISYIDISLLEALKGCTKNVRTCYGYKNLKIKDNIKNSESVRVKGFGVGNKGFHIFKVNVKYPDDKESLIKFLEKEPIDNTGE